MTFLLNLLPWLKRWWKPVVAALAVGAAVWYVWSAITTYGQTRYDAGFAKRDAQYKDELDKLRDSYVKQIEDLQRTNHEISTSYQNQLAGIRRQPAPRTVRVCEPAPGGVPQAPGTGAPSGSDATTAEALSQALGPDIGPFLYGEADTSDALALQLEHLQEWVTRVCVNREHLRTSF